MKSLTLGLFVTATVALAALSGGCADTERSRDLANPTISSTTIAQQVCSNRYGMTGHAVSPNFPNLAGQVESCFVAQLSEFRRHSRQDPAGFEYMRGLSRSLTDDQIKGLAAYCAKQTPTPQAIEGDCSRFEAGKSIFEAGVADKGIPACAGCHGSQGQGNASFPRLAGQHADYLVKQLVVFQRTDERPAGSVMKVVAHALTQQNIVDLARCLQALPSL